MSGKLIEILESGRAPGFVSGSTVDPNSVLRKAPKALRELESEQIYKHGPARGAGRIGQHFGMSAERIKKIWAKPFSALFIFMACLSSFAGPLSAGVNFVDGQTVHAADLNNLVNNGNVNPSLISGQPADATPLQGDFIILYSPTLNGLFKATLLSVVYNNSQSITLLPAGNPNFTNADKFAFYNAASTNNQAVTFSNLVLNIATNFNLSVIHLTYTNPASGTNIPFLPNYTGNLTGLNTNSQAFFLVWNGTNGIPSQIAISNLEAAIAGDFGTNLSLSFVYNQMFFPQNVYGTNSVTNAWGNVVFPITNLLIAANQTQTLSNIDTIPINSSLQGSNTVVNLATLKQFIVGAQAKVIFSGVPLTLTITNANTTDGILATSNGLGFWATSPAYPAAGIPYPIDFATNGATFYFLGVKTNQVYYVTALSTNSNFFRVFSTYAAAVSQTNWIPITSTSSGTQQMFYLTNFTSFNCDAIQATTSGNLASAGR